MGRMLNLNFLDSERFHISPSFKAPTLTFGIAQSFAVFSKYVSDFSD